MGPGLYDQKGLLGGPTQFTNQNQLGGLLQGIAADPSMPAHQLAQNLQAAGLGPSGSPSAPVQSAPAQPAPAAAPQRLTPPAPVAPQPTRDGPNPLSEALMMGGVTVAQGAAPAGSLGRALAEGIAVGTKAFTAAKDAKADREAALAAQEAYRARVSALQIDPSAKAGLLSMGPAEGGKLLAQMGIDITKQNNEGYTLKPGEARYRGGKAIAYLPEAAKPFDVNSIPADVREAIQMTTGRDIRDPEAFGKPLTEEERRRAADYLNSQARPAGATRISTSVAGPNLDTADKEMWKGAVAALTSDYERVRNVPNRVELYDRILSQVKDDKYFYGPASNLQQFAGTLAAQFGLPVNIEKISNTQTLMSALNEAAIARIKELDGRPTDKDMEILLQAMGNTKLTPTALRNIIGSAKQTAKASLRQYEQRVRAMERDLEGSGYRVPSYLKSLEPLAPPAPAGGAQPSLRNVFGLPTQ